ICAVIHWASFPLSPERFTDWRLSLDSRNCQTFRVPQQSWGLPVINYGGMLGCNARVETVWNRSDTKRLVPLDSNYSSTDRLALPLELQFPGGSIGKLDLDVSVSFLGNDNLS